MRVLLIGCGAVGIGIAAALYDAGADADLVAKGKTAESIRCGGIERHGLFRDVVVPKEKLRVYEDIRETRGGYDYVLVTAKTTGNADIAEGLRSRGAGLLNDGGLIVLCQNGFGNEHAFSRVTDLRNIFHASFAIGFRRPQRNVSEVTVFSSPVLIGSLQGEPTRRISSLVDAIADGGIPCRPTDEIGKTLWSKLLYNCSLNPLSAILHVNYGGLMAGKNAPEIMNTIIDEIFAVMQASGGEAFWKDSASYQKDFYEKILPPTYGHRSSTLQDIERKIPTEIDSLNGAVVRLGKKYHVPTPYNEMIVRLVKAEESLYQYGE